MSEHLLYEAVRAVTPTASVLLQRNPGPMTLDGTNTWLLRAPGSGETVVVDPGESSEEHLDLLLAAAPTIALVLVTHGHFDHSQSAAELHERTGAPVHAVDPQHCHGGDTLRGFETSGVGPRDTVSDDALGGKYFYRGSAELTFPVGLPQEMGVAGHAFTDFGSLWGLDNTSGPGIIDETAIRASAPPSPAISPVATVINAT